MLNSFIKDEEGMGTVELVLIIAALVAIALLFRDRIMKFMNDALGKVFGDDTKSGLEVKPSEAP